MTYIERNLRPDETIVFKASVHPIYQLVLTIEVGLALMLVTVIAASGYVLSALFM